MIRGGLRRRPSGARLEEEKKKQASTLASRPRATRPRPPTWPGNPRQQARHTLPSSRTGGVWARAAPVCAGRTCPLPLSPPAPHRVLSPSRMRSPLPSTPSTPTHPPGRPPHGRPAQRGRPRRLPGVGREPGEQRNGEARRGGEAAPCPSARPSPSQPRNTHPPHSPRARSPPLLSLSPSNRS